MAEERGALLALLLRLDAMDAADAIQGICLTRELGGQKNGVGGGSGQTGSNSSLEKRKPRQIGDGEDGI
jgi:hypothetical protein